MGAWSKKITVSGDTGGDISDGIEVPLRNCILQQLTVKRDSGSDATGFGIYLYEQKNGSDDYDSGTENEYLIYSSTTTTRTFFNDRDLVEKFTARQGSMESKSIRIVMDVSGGSGSQSYTVIAGGLAIG